MENQDLDLIGQTVGNMPYKVGIVDKDGKLANQFVVNASTNRIDIPQAILGAAQSTLPQIPSTLNPFSGSAVGNIVLLGVTPDYSNIQDGLLITLGNQTLAGPKKNRFGNVVRADLSSLGLIQIKIPKEKLIVNSSFDISDQLSQYIRKLVQGQFYDSDSSWGSYNDKTFDIVSFGGTAIQVLPNSILNMSLTVHIKEDHQNVDEDFLIPAIQVNDYKN